MLSGSQIGLLGLRREGPEETMISVLISEGREKLTEDTANSKGNRVSSEWKARQWSKVFRCKWKAGSRQEWADPMNTRKRQIIQQELPGWITLRFPYQLRQEFESRMKLLFTITGPKVRKFISCDSASIPGSLVTEVCSHKRPSRLRDSIFKDLYNYVAYIRIHLTG